MRAHLGFGNRLFRHDRLIAVNAARASFAGWNDRLMLVAALCIALATLRSWFGNQAWSVAAWVALGAGIGIGLWAGRLVAARIAFHRADGVLAADALQPALCRRYALAWHGIGLLTLAGVTVVARPSLLVIIVPAYITGALVGSASGRLALQGLAGEPTIGRTVRRRLHRPGTGIVAALLVLLCLLPAQSLEPTGQLVIGIAAVLCAGVLTVVDPKVVRFTSISGHAPWRIVGRHAYGLLAFAGVAALGCGVAAGPVAAGVVLAVSAGALLLLALRVFGYCVYSKRAADFLISIVIGVFALAAYAMILLLPLVIGALLWQFQRRAAAKTWVLA